MIEIQLESINFIQNSHEFILENYVRVLTQGLDERDNYPIKPSHFLPYTKFENETDLSNGDLYYDPDQTLIKSKCLLLMAVTPIMHAISTLFNLANRIVKIVLLAHFWYPFQDTYLLKERIEIFCKDLLRVSFSPLIYIGLEVAAIYGTISPQNGRKLYATLERAAFGKEVLAPCFQPFSIQVPD